jgi:diadenosine tetraphosphatase ApaH/serine/threonine PP2A family protein phosphatase
MDRECLRLIGQVVAGVADFANIEHCLPTVEHVTSICRKVIPVLGNDPVLLKLNGSFVVTGDIHGNIEDLVRIFGTVGYPPHVRYLFLGDYVDRGKHAIEVLTLLYCLKVLFPSDIYLLRGNHESVPMSSGYGFKSECTKRTSEAMYAMFTSTFHHLPLACVLNNTVFCVHGGISPRLVHVSDLTSLANPVSIPKEGLIADLLWSDPQDGVREWQPSARGIAHNFGHAALASFLSRNSLALVIRAHQSCRDGFQWAFANNPESTGKCLTVFSSSDYCNLGNDSAVVSINEGDNAEPKFTVFAALKPCQKEKRRVIFPLWLLGGWHIVDELKWDDGPASEPNIV